jgi:hypothetical protein
MPYQEDTGKKDQGRVLLDEGSVPSVPNEDDPAIMATITPMVGEDGGTYKALSK